MIQRLLGSHVGQLLRGRLAERTAGGGQDQLGDLVAASGAKALVSAIVFAVDGNQIDAGFLRRRPSPGVPPATRISLLASPMRFPRRMAS